MTFPDVETLLVGWLSGHLAGMRVVTDTPSNLASLLPVVQVTRFGGGDHSVALDVANIDVDTYAATRQGAAELAEQVRYALLFILPGQNNKGVVVTRTDTLIGPSWRAYENTALRRFGATYQLTVHAMRNREVAP
jgi:hypothetical protein